MPGAFQSQLAQIEQLLAAAPAAAQQQQQKSHGHLVAPSQHGNSAPARREKEGAKESEMDKLVREWEKEFGLEEILRGRGEGKSDEEKGKEGKRK